MRLRIIILVVSGYTAPTVGNAADMIGAPRRYEGTTMADTKPGERINREQAEKLGEKIGPMMNYALRVRNRMDKAGLRRPRSSATQMPKGFGRYDSDSNRRIQA